MTEIHGPLSVIGAAAGEAITAHSSLTPDQKTAHYVSYSAGALGWCFYLAPRAFADTTSTMIWAAVGTVALLSLIAALRAASGQRSPLAMLWRLLFGGGCAALLWYRVYPDWGAAAVFLLKGCYIGWLAMNAARFVLATGLGQGNARRIIERELRRQNAPLRRARPHNPNLW